jgi:hypothetical protein
MVTDVRAHQDRRALAEVITTGLLCRDLLADDATPPPREDERRG